MSSSQQQEEEDNRSGANKLKNPNHSAIDGQQPNVDGFEPQDGTTAAAAAAAGEGGSGDFSIVNGPAAGDENGNNTTTNENENGDDGDEVADLSKWHKNAFGWSVVKHSGYYSKEESELVRQSVEEFCAAKQISVARLCSECDHKAELKGAWMEIAKRLPHRSVQSVYRHGIRRLHPFKRGSWNEDECSALVELVARLGKKWSTIQGKLNRSADSCRDKYREMSDDYVKGRWKEPELEMLKNLIREQVGVPNSTDMKEVGRIVEEKGIQIPWSTISRRMMKRSRLSCFKKWQKLIGVVAEEEEGGSPPPGSQQQDEQSSSPSQSQQPTTTAAAAENDGTESHPKGHKSNSRKRKGAPTEEEDGGGEVEARAAAASPTNLPLVAPPFGVVGDTAAEDDVEYDDAYSAKIADETVQAVDLPEVRRSFV